MKKQYHFIFFTYDWNNEVTLPYFRGVEQFLYAHPDARVTIVEGFGRYGERDIEKSSLQIFNVPQLSKCDGIIIQGNGVWKPALKQKLADRALANNIPVVSVNYELDNCMYVGTDNYTAMKSMVEHVITTHQANRLAFICGLSGSREAEARARAFRDCCREHRIPEYNCRLYSGSWAQVEGEKAARQIIKEAMDEAPNDFFTRLPDAIICANDDLAVGAARELQKNGVRIPENVILTGFDHLSIGETNRPQLTTISRDYAKIAYQSLQNLYDQVTGRHTPKKVFSPSRIVEGRSCGCADRQRLTDRLLDRFFRMESVTKQYYVLRDQAGPELDKAEELADIMKTFETYGLMVGAGNAYLVLNKDYLTHFQHAESVRHYGDNMLLMGISDPDGQWNGQHNEKHIYAEFGKQELLPERFRANSQLMLVYPLHYEEICIGYVIGNRVSESMEFQFLEFTLKHLENAIESVRQKKLLKTMNTQLNELYVRDNLTNLYNRFGLLKYGEQFLNKIRSEKKSVFVVFADLDDMKMINDTYGHDDGDEALRKSAEILRRAAHDCRSVLVRYGGDEFVALSDERLSDRLSRAQIELKREYPELDYLNYSVGEYEVDWRDTCTMQEAIDRADDLMYEIKREKKKRRMEEKNH